MKPQVRRSVIVACVSTIGLFVMCFVEAAEEVYWRLWTVDFVQTDTFYFLVNTGYEYSVWSLPISMICMFPEVFALPFQTYKSISAPPADNSSPKVQEEQDQRDQSQRIQRKSNWVNSLNKTFSNS